MRPAKSLFVLRYVAIRMAAVSGRLGAQIRQGVGMRVPKNTTIPLVVLFAAAAIARAQTSTREVNDTVTDDSGGAISGAAVKLTNQRSQVTKESQTNANGYSVFINMLPGSYVLTVHKHGFETPQVNAFDIQVNQTLTQKNRLNVGAISESVTVTAASLLQSY